MQNQYDKLKRILREMFQMDQADLDFGIYRIMNQRRKELEKFLDEDLLPQVKTEFGKYQDTQSDGKKQELEKLEKTLREAQVDPDTNPKIIQLRKDIAAGFDEDALANEVFSHLTTFFRRYYDGGDFLSLRRYKKDTYAIPYEGEEVKLHWANADQYYIKTTEYLRDYTFKLSGKKRVHFKLVNATEEKDNVKEQKGKERRFKLHEEEPFKIDENELYIQFVYLPDKTKQDDLNKQTVDFIKQNAGKLTEFQEIYRAEPTEKNKNRTLFEKHLTKYTARFNFDFFIHKDLGGFLHRELDFYLKNEVIFIDDIDAHDERNLKLFVAKAKVIKHIAIKLIDMLAQLEDFQKKLWLKKKFVVDCGYCVTIDRVPESLYDDIRTNKNQIKEWIDLYSINEIKGDLARPAFSIPLTIEFLKANPYLMLDTKHFSSEFKDNLLASFDNFDEQCDGVIINSENFQALNLLQEKYKEKVKCIYIDPPYNTEASEIIYKNGYKHASWLSLLADRLIISKETLKDSGIIQVAIDDEEFSRLENIIKQIYGTQNFIANIAIMHNPKGRDKEHVASSHEYIIMAAKIKNNAITNRLILTNEQLSKKYNKETDKGLYRELGLRRSGSGAQREDRPYMFFPFIFNPISNTLSVIAEDEYKNIFNGHKFDDEYVDLLRNKYEEQGLCFILPIRQDGSFGRWRWGYKSSKKGATEGILFVKREDNSTIYQLDYEDSTFLPKTFWYGERYDASTKGTNLLKSIIGSNPFDYPKSIFAVEDMVTIASNDDDLILDYFAGSGTTAHAVINLNREDDGRRKYILVEMGEYFDTVLKPRIMKVVYSKDWKDGKPVSREGSSHTFKYMKLESYDDTLDNLIVQRSAEQELALIEHGSVREDYLLRYWLDIETGNSDSLLNLDKFDDPFNYTLRIRQDDEMKETKIDLIETFNYLIGLYVEQTETIRGFKVIRGRLRTGEKTLVIWRNVREKSNTDLDEFFLKQKYNTRDLEFYRIYVNGDNNLENLKVEEDKWKVAMIEEEFKKRMFDVREI
ncbi:MAG: site-specific DNA-methyltransferase [Candidatus Auribacterota bacterium]|jgi:adenine-specific DNA-methyltransferase|nr:site-specific DNA-methyltransferase [Candidatus Auribacterota bacterium]